VRARNLFRAALVLVGVLAVALLLVGVTSKLYRIPSSAMEPTLHCPRDSQIPGCLGNEADRILVSRVLYKVRDPERGDIVAYELPAAGAARCGSPEGSTFVHRIVGLPGERVEIRAGRVIVDGRLLDEDYLEDGRRTGDALRPRVIPDDRYLVLGDNRTQSCDSRVWGYVPRSRIIGPKIATYWPEDRISIR
jgi:signal peptidase I